ncbi:hypothetical protein T552_01947 [Pneumocystis carinii B80]|uniref:Cell division control protein 50 n=1 Tax=Pneumocystis carinii (strain B80) TaxID=1408658 RepID=A0A0W4ZI72_PNEC8|nr:hypothetical protein T552_01947 [Pneumocystis carinii B80]KTW28086.1 hypothetical protein T552_01947 [Pneumocystis carinii B80]
MRKPPNTDFYQQRLKAWHPILTPKYVFPIFFALGLIFIPLGGILFYFSSQVYEIAINYTYCDKQASLGEFRAIPEKYVQMSFPSNVQSMNRAIWKKKNNERSAYSIKETICLIRFEIPVDLKPPIFVYYRLTNFYQNHRRYVKSLSKDQMMGYAKTAAELRSSDDCNPLSISDDGKPIYPCGLIANSMFNDTISSPKKLSSLSGMALAPYFMTNKGISWSSDKKIYIKTSYRPSDVSPPPNWILRYPNGYNETNFPNINEWEEFHVWMKTAGLPTFEKLALRNDSSIMKAGAYEIEIAMHFPVTKYNGSKTIIISTRSFIGGRNLFFSILYIISGALSFIVGTFFTCCYLFKPRKLGDHRYLSWNQAPYHNSLKSMNTTETTSH